MVMRYERRAARRPEGRHTDDGMIQKKLDRRQETAMAKQARLFLWSRRWCRGGDGNETSGLGGVIAKTFCHIRMNVSRKIPFSYHHRR